MSWRIDDGDERIAMNAAGTSVMQPMMTTEAPLPMDTANAATEDAAYEEGEERKSFPRQNEEAEVANDGTQQAEAEAFEARLREFVAFGLRHSAAVLPQSTVSLKEEPQSVENDEEQGGGGTGGGASEGVPSEEPVKEGNTGGVMSSGMQEPEPEPEVEVEPKVGHVNEENLPKGTAEEKPGIKRSRNSLEMDNSERDYMAGEKQVSYREQTPADMKNVQDPSPSQMQAYKQARKDYEVQKYGNKRHGREMDIYKDAMNEYNRSRQSNHNNQPHRRDPVNEYRSDASRDHRERGYCDDANDDNTRSQRERYESKQAAFQKRKYKSEMCRFWKNKGRCHNGSKCPYAHGEHELSFPAYSNRYAERGEEPKRDPEKSPQNSRRPRESPPHPRAESPPQSRAESPRHESNASDVPIETHEAPAPGHSKAEGATTLNNPDPNEVLYVPMTREVYEYIQKILAERPRMVVEELKLSTSSTTPPAATTPVKMTQGGEGPGEATHKRREPAAVQNNVAGAHQPQARTSSQAATGNAVVKKGNGRQSCTDERGKIDDAKRKTSATLKRPTFKRHTSTAPDRSKPTSAREEWWKKKTPCKYFAAGTCKNGDSCPFAHVKHVPVRSYQRTGANAMEVGPRATDTKKTPRCPVAPIHTSADDERNERTVSYRKNASLGPCRSLFIKGSCLDPQCKYSHDEPSTEELSALMNSSN